MVEAADELQMKIHLSPDFISQSITNAAIEKVLQAGADGTFEKVAGRVNHPGEAIGRQRTMSTTNDQMKTNVEPGIFAREERSLVARGRRDHQARRSQDALVMRAKNPGVDLARIAEVISGDDNGSGRGR
jgi:hypothetical protein